MGVTDKESAHSSDTSGGWERVSDNSQVRKPYFNYILRNHTHVERRLKK